MDGRMDGRMEVGWTAGCARARARAFHAVHSTPYCALHTRTPLLAVAPTSPYYILVQLY